MALTTGTRLGSYEIVSPIGAGGMGEVYRARDTRLGREVAIKVLPEAFARDDERMKRFEREAQVLASLNHPNIAAIYGVEQNSLVLELVEGETLAERIARGPIPIEETLRLFQQIAEGLEAAHEKWIVHRDLKPANIKVTPAGKIKILDFGLAKAFAEGGTESGLSESPTVTRGTADGVILGTAPYMSPEQARGKAVDKRADIWAFGCCLYEALTGKAAFIGETVTDTLAKIVEREPDWEALPESTPAIIRALLGRCLRKDSERRLRDVGDARIEIEDASSGPSEGLVVSSVPVSAVGWQRVLPWILVALLAAVATWSLMERRRESAPVVRTSINLPLAQEQYWSPAIPPDGTRVVYRANEGNQRKLYMRRLDRDESTPIPETEGGDRPFFSPDGKWIGFFADGQLKKIPLDGGLAVALCEVPSSRGGAWGPDGDIVFPLSGNTGLMRLPADGGTPEILTTLDEGELGHRWPQVLPNGTAVLFLALTSSIIDDSIIWVQSLETGERRSLGSGSYARYVSTGHLIYARAQTLYAVPFDIERLEVKGTGVPVQGDVWTPGFGVSRPGAVAFSETGTLVYRPAFPTKRRLFFVDLQGRSEPLSAPLLPYEQARFSPDGRSLAVTTEDGKVHLYELEHDRMTLLISQFEDSSGALWTPVGSVAWSPEGKRLAFDAIREGGSANIFVTTVDGRGNPEALLEQERLRFVDGWSPDGKRILYNEKPKVAPSSEWDIWDVPLEANGTPRHIVQDPDRQIHPNLSTDGRWLAYDSRSNRIEVYVRPYEGTSGGRQISIDGGVAPVWAPSGREVYYRNGDKVMAVEITTEPEFSAGRPRLLFEGPYDRASWKPRRYDLSPDGRRFVMMQSERDSASPSLKVVLNWFEELKRLVPVN